MNGGGAGRFDKRAYYDEIADDYAAHVVSPYELGVELPLAGDLDRWFRGAPRDALVVDFGCGTGQALELVAGRGGLTLGLDYSQGMLRAAARRLRKGRVRRLKSEPLSPRMAQREMKTRDAGRTRLVEGDLHALEWLRGQVDLAVASNSITDETAARSDHMFDQVAATLKRGGELLAIFPSLDATEYVMQLHVERSGEVPEDLGVLDTEGVYEVDGLRQRFWSPDQLSEACARNGLEVRELSKITFTWEAMAESGWGDFEGEAPMWDWYLRASRAS